LIQLIYLDGHQREIFHGRTYDDICDQLWKTSRLTSDNRRGFMLRTRALVKLLHPTIEIDTGSSEAFLKSLTQLGIYKLINSGDQQLVMPEIEELENQHGRKQANTDDQG